MAEIRDLNKQSVQALFGGLAGNLCQQGVDPGVVRSAMRNVVESAIMWQMMEAIKNPGAIMDAVFKLQSSISGPKPLKSKSLPKCTEEIGHAWDASGVCIWCGIKHPEAE